jgi:hypothetical protein
MTQVATGSPSARLTADDDLSAIGTARSAKDPDPRPWYEVHSLDPADPIVVAATTAGKTWRQK